MEEYRRWEDSIKMNTGIEEIGIRMMNWMELSQYRDRRKALINKTLNFRVP